MEDSRYLVKRTKHLDERGRQRQDEILRNFSGAFGFPATGKRTGAVQISKPPSWYGLMARDQFLQGECAGFTDSCKLPRSEHPPVLN